MKVRSPPPLGFITSHLAMEGLLATLLCLLPALTCAEAAVQAWVQHFLEPGHYDDLAVAAAVGGSNNVIVTGHSRRTGNQGDYAKIEYSSGRVPLWLATS